MLHVHISPSHPIITRCQHPPNHAVLPPKSSPPTPPSHAHRHITTRDAAAAVSTLDVSHRDTLTALTHAADALRVAETRAHEAAVRVMHAVRMLCNERDQDTPALGLTPPEEETEDGAAGVLVSVGVFAVDLQRMAQVVHGSSAQAAGAVGPHVWSSAVDALCTDTVCVGVCTGCGMC